MNVISYCNNDAKNVIKNVVNESKLVLKKSIEKRNFLIDKKQIKQLNLHDALNSLIESKFSNSAIRNIIIKYFEESKNVPFADVILSLCLIHETIPKKITGVRLPNEIIKEEALKLSTPQNQNIINLALEFSNFDSSLNTNFHSIKRDLIKIDKSIKFNFKVNELFYHNCKIENNLELLDCDAILINGSPQSVSELNRIFEYYAKLKTNCILIAKSFPEDVLGTLIANYNMGSLKIIPLERNDDVFAINDISDFSFFLKGNYITPDKGDLISTYEPKDSNKFSKVTINRNFFSIHDDEACNVSKKLLNKLKEKLKDETLEDKISLINERIKNINLNSTEIYIYDDKTFYSKFRMKNINKSIKYYSQCCSNGMVDIALIDDKIKNYFLLNNIKYISLNSYNFGIKLAEDLFQSLNSIGCILSCD